MPNDINPGITFTLNQQNINAPQMNAIAGSAVINPSFVSTKPSATTMAQADTLLMYSQSGQVLKQIPYSSLSAQLQGGVQAAYNALHNGDMAVNQNQLYLTNNGATSGGTLFTTVDRWRFSRSAAATLRPAFAQTQVGTNGTIVSPNPPFDYYLNTTVGTTQGSLAAGDFGLLRQGIENVNALPLLGSPMSLSFLYNTNTAGTFYISFQDSTAANSYVTPFTTVGDSAWHLVTIPNIPSTSGPNFGQALAPGNLGMTVNICLGAGSTFQTATTNAWVAGNFYCGTNQTNFWNGASSFMNLTQFMLNPGPACSSFVSIPFLTNLTTCQRYYCQTRSYGLLPYASNAWGPPLFFLNATTAYGSVYFPVPMAYNPTVMLGCSALPGQVENWAIGAVRTFTSAGGVTNTGFGSITGSGFIAGDSAYYAQFAAIAEF